MSSDRVGPEHPEDARSGLRVLAMIAAPFFALLVAGVALFATGALEAPGAVEADLDREGRVLTALRETPPTDAGPLIQAWNTAPAEWTERQTTAFRSLSARIGWPLDLDPAVDPARLTTAPPAEWDEAEQGSAQALLDLFERRWPSLPRR